MASIHRLKALLVGVSELLQEEETAEQFGGRDLVAFVGENGTCYGLAQKHASIETASDVELLVAKEDDLSTGHEYPIGGFRKSGKTKTLATEALTVLTAADFLEAFTTDVKTKGAGLWARIKGAGKYDEDKHKRDHGRFARTNGSGGNKPKPKPKKDEKPPVKKDEAKPKADADKPKPKPRTPSPIAKEFSKHRDAAKESLESILDSISNWEDYDPSTGDSPERDRRNAYTVAKRMADMISQQDGDNWYVPSMDPRDTYADSVENLRTMAEQLDDMLYGAELYDPETEGDSPKEDIDSMRNLARQLSTLDEDLVVDNFEGSADDEDEDEDSNEDDSESPASRYRNREDKDDSDVGDGEEDEDDEETQSAHDAVEEAIENGDLNEDSPYEEIVQYLTDDDVSPEVAARVAKDMGREPAEKKDPKGKRPPKKNEDEKPTRRSTFSTEGGSVSMEDATKAFFADVDKKVKSAVDRLVKDGKAEWRPDPSVPDVYGLIDKETGKAHVIVYAKDKDWELSGDLEEASYGKPKATKPDKGKDAAKTTVATLSKYIARAAKVSNALTNKADELDSNGGGKNGSQALLDLSDNIDDVMKEISRWHGEDSGYMKPATILSMLKDDAESGDLDHDRAKTYAKELGDLLAQAEKLVGNTAPKKKCIHLPSRKAKRDVSGQ